MTCAARYLAVVATCCCAAACAATTQQADDEALTRLARRQGDRRRAATSEVLSLSMSEQLGELAPTRRWSVTTTGSFSIYHFNPELAGQIALAAEQQRAGLLLRWIGPGEQTPWRPRCQIALYPTTMDLVQMTGGDAKAGSAATRAARLTPGQTLSRTIQLAEDDPALLVATLPHEITHVVASEAIGGRVPLWANEGMATLAEPPARHRAYEHHALQAAATGRLLPLAHLTGLREYPEARRLFYAQSFSLTRFLVARRGPHAFVAFVRTALRLGYPAALQRHYGIAGFAELERLWIAAARRQ